MTPVQPAPPVTGLPSGPRVELYDARLDPWNAPDEGQVAPSGPRDHGAPVGAGGVFTFECTAWWRVYIYYVWLCLGSREYWLLDLTLRE